MGVPNSNDFEHVPEVSWTVSYSLCLALMGGGAASGVPFAEQLVTKPVSLRNQGAQ